MVSFFSLFTKRKNKIEACYAKVLESLFYNNKDAAILHLTELVKDRTDKPIAYLWLGRLLQERGELSRAEMIFENLARRPRLTKHLKAVAWRSAARVASMLGHKDKEISALGFYSVLEPNDSMAEANYLFLKAKEALSHDNTGEAIAYLQGSIKADPRFGDSYVLLGDQYAETSPRRGLRIWRRLLKLRPDLIVELGPKIREIYERLGKGGRYEIFLRRLSGRSKNSGYPYLFLGRFYLEMKEFEHAKANLELARGIETTRQTASIELMNIAMERWDKSLAFLAAATIGTEKMLWKCGVCGEKVVKGFLPSCQSCGNSTDLYLLEE